MLGTALTYYLVPCAMRIQNRVPAAYSIISKYIEQELPMHTYDAIGMVWDQHLNLFPSYLCSYHRSIHFVATSDVLIFSLNSMIILIMRRTAQSRMFLIAKTREKCRESSDPLEEIVLHYFPLAARAPENGPYQRGLHFAYKVRLTPFSIKRSIQTRIVNRVPN